MADRPPADEHDPSRRRFLGAAGVTAAATALPAEGAPQAAFKPPPFPYEEATIRQLGERMRSGALTAVALTKAYLERIAALDRDGPQLRSIIEINGEAIATAERMDAERKAGKVRGPLHGIPIVLKDNIPTGDRMPTTAGSLALENLRIGEDAPVVKRLRDAGAVILAKANLSEWANFRSTQSLSGWSSRGGQCRSPYALDRSPSGSSSGSAVAVSANLCVAALGTETDGSISSPSACNSIVSLKPTMGWVSRTSVIPIATSQDVVGPMARTVEDCALLMNAITGPDPLDAVTVAPSVPKTFDFTANLGRKDLKGVRLGILRQYSGSSEKAERVIEAAFAKLKELGADMVDVTIPTIGKFERFEVEVMFHEFKAGINEWLLKYMPTGPHKSLEDLIRYNDRNADKMMPFFGQDAFIKAQGKGPLNSPVYRNALAQCRLLTRTQGIDEALKKHNVSALVALTAPPAWLLDPITGDYARGGCTSLPAVSGYPHVSVPAGFARELPVGLAFIGPAFSDAMLFGLAQVYETATKNRKPPKFLPSIP